MPPFGFGIETPKKRTLGIRDKQILYERAKGKCEACRKKIEFSEMQTGHKTAASKGGSATLRNSVCLCYKCNKLQGTDSWATFIRKIGKSKTRTVTSGKKRKPTKKKPKRKSSSDSLWGSLFS
jgi:5-methylcytosine-specific restriction endonuclease McrA